MKSKKSSTLDNIEALRFALNNQIGWQKFAEAKLLFLLTVSGTSVVSLNRIIAEFNGVNDTMIFKVVIGIFGVCSFISFSLALIGIAVSFKRFRHTEEFKTKQIINWKYAMQRSVEELIEDSKKYDDEKQRYDILIQHHLGSKITKLKYQLFNYGATFFSIGVIALFVYIVNTKVL